MFTGSEVYDATIPDTGIGDGAVQSGVPVQVRYCPAKVVPAAPLFESDP